jgi:hypothetical protein
VTCTQATGSDIIVDGNHVYSPSGAAFLYSNATKKSYELVPFPTMTYQRSGDPLTGDLQITEHDELVKCDPVGTAFILDTTDPAWNTACSAWMPAGVQVDRTIAQDRAGRRGTITDVWTSTTGTPHQIELRYDQEFAGDPTQFMRPSVRYPWLGASYATPTVGQTIAVPSGEGPATVIVDGNGELIDLFSQPQVAIRFSPRPADIHWYYAQSYFVFATFRVTGTVPATGGLTIEHTYFMQPTKALLDDALDPPAIAITAPADASIVEQADVTVSGTAADPTGTVESVTVNGTAVSLQPDGSWSTPLTLTEGSNLVTAVATDATGNTATATATVTLATDGPPPPPPPPPGGGAEICGNCVDDDANGLVDFEDPACCTAGALTVKRLGIAATKHGTSLTLQAGLTAAASATDDVALQLRAASGEILCARVPTANLVRTKKAARFADPKHRVASAAGVDKLLLRAKKGIAASGRRMSLAVPPAGAVQVTFALRDPATAEQGNRCAGAQVTVQARKNGSLHFP